MLRFCDCFGFALCAILTVSGIRNSRVLFFSLLLCKSIKCLPNFSSSLFSSPIPADTQSDDDDDDDNGYLFYVHSSCVIQNKQPQQHRLSHTIPFKQTTNLCKMARRHRASIYRCLSPSNAVSSHLSLELYVHEHEKVGQYNFHSIIPCVERKFIASNTTHTADVYNVPDKLIKCASAACATFIWCRRDEKKIKKN